MSTDQNQLSHRPFVQPSVRVWESPDDVELVAEVPGADEGTTEVVIENDVLTVTARVSGADAGPGKLVYSELRDGDYRRTFRLPEAIDRQRIEAHVKHGILRVRLPKSDLAKTRKVTVLAG